MRHAPTYRNIEQQNTLLGLTFPMGFGIQLTLSWVWMLCFNMSTALVLMVASYAVIRAASFRRAPMFLEHALGFAIRRVVYAGRFSALARDRRSLPGRF